MPFMERLHSALILKTPMHHPNEAHIVEQPHREFLDAIRRGDQSAVEERILSGFDVDHAESTHTPPLIYAILHERFNIVQTLLNYGANANVYDHRHSTPLHVAVRLKQDQSAHLLMRYGADPKTKDDNGVSPLELAAGMHSKSTVKILKQTPPMLKEPISLFEAAKRGDLLSIAYADKRHDRLFALNEKGQSLLHLAVLSDHTKLVAYLLNKALDIDAIDNHGNTPLGIAVAHGVSTTILEYLIKRHATIEHKNNNHATPLMLALARGNSPHCDMLLDAGANIHTTDGIHTPITLCHNAIERFEEEADAFRNLQSRLLIKGANVDEYTNDLHWTPLMMIITHPQSEKLENHFDLLLKLGAKVNHQDRNGRSALMLACSTGRTQMVRRLIDNYANPDLIDVFGWSALMFAVYYNHVRLVHILLEYGADVNASSEKGLTAMKIATQYERTLMVELLLDYGAIEEEDENRE